MGKILSTCSLCKRQKTDDPESDVSFTKEEIKKLRKQWDIMMSDVDGNGIMLFTALFSINSHLMSKFAFAAAYGFDGENTYDDDRLSKHVKGVFNVIDTVINSFVTGNFCKEQEKLKQIGKIHGESGVEYLHMQDFKTAFLQTLSKELKEEFDKEASEAWSKLIDILVDCMDLETYEVEESHNDTASNALVELTDHTINVLKQQ